MPIFSPKRRIVSMTASSHGDVPRGMGFLLNRNRVHVADMFNGRVVRFEFLGGG